MVIPCATPRYCYIDALKLFRSEFLPVARTIMMMMLNDELPKSLTKIILLNIAVALQAFQLKLFSIQQFHTPHLCLDCSLYIFSYLQFYVLDMFEIYYLFID